MQTASTILDRALSASNGGGLLGLVGAVIIAAVALLLRSATFPGAKRPKQRGGVFVEVGGEEGVTLRHGGSPDLIEVPWEGATTMANMFEQSCQKHWKLRLLGSRNVVDAGFVQGSDGRKLEKLHLGEYVWMTYGETFDCASNFASGLVKAGHHLDSPAAIVAETRKEFFIALQGCFRQNLTVVTAYASLGRDALVHLLNEARVSTLICDSKQLDMLAAIYSKLETVKTVVYFEGDASPPNVSAVPEMSHVSFSDVQQLGKADPLQPRLPSKGDIALVMYTSGTTGIPKGVMITHANMVASVAGVLGSCPPYHQNDVFLAYLPMTHVFELICEFAMLAVGGAIGYGSTLTLTDTSPKIQEGARGDAPALKPTIMAAVPAVLNGLRDGVLRKIEEKGGITQRLFNLAYRRCLEAQNGSRFGAWEFEKILWDAIVFKGIRSILGGRIWFVICGGAPLSQDVHRFISICTGAHVKVAYGLTETFAGATFSEPDDMSVGRVGSPIACSYVKLVSWKEGGYLSTDEPMPRGEIVVGGWNVSAGYLNNEKLTNEVYKVDKNCVRWFYTGDIGRFHPDGVVEIIDRKKDIVKLQHGEYISLGKVEAALRCCKYIDNVMVDAHPLSSYCVALVVVSHHHLKKWAEGAGGIEYRDVSDLCERVEAVQEVHQSLVKEAKNLKLGKFEIPVKIRLFAEAWTPESGLVTNALKIKREQLKMEFKDELQKLYG